MKRNRESGQASESDSSSSEDENWAALASVAVSFEQVSSQQAEIAQKAQRRKTKKPKLTAPEAGRGAEASDDDVDGTETLDLTQLKIAAALDAMIESRFIPLLAKVKQKADGNIAEQQTEELCTVRLFRQVTVGEPCILERPEEHYKALLPKAKDSITQTQKWVAKNASHAALQQAAIDGLVLMKFCIARLAQTSKAQQKLPQSGTVVEGKRPFVPFDVRTARLLGRSCVS